MHLSWSTGSAYRKSSLRKKKYSLVIFDWDGTLVDSVPNIVSALKLAAGDFGLPLLSDVSYRNIIGLSLGPALLQLYPHLDDSGLGGLRESYKDHHLRLERQASKPFSGVVNGLSALNDAGMLMAVATGKRRAGLQRSMAANGYQDFFHASRTADDAQSKPHPDMLEQLLKELEVPADQALMVGDSSFDMGMAKSAGIDGVAVTYGAQSRKELESWQPVMVADQFDEFIHWLMPCRSSLV